MLGSADEAMARAAERYRFAQRLVVTGRGYAYLTAREAALTLMETSYVAAQAFSGADLLHGPVAMLDAAVRVLAVAPDGVAGHAILPVLQRVRAAPRRRTAVAFDRDLAVPVAVGPDQIVHRLDGLGPFLGDEGGGASIGRAGLRAALRSLERRGPATALAAEAER